MKSEVTQAPGDEGTILRSEKPKFREEPTACLLISSLVL